VRLIIYVSLIVSLAVVATSVSQPSPPPSQLTDEQSKLINQLVQNQTKDYPVTMAMIEGANPKLLGIKDLTLLNQAAIRAIPNPDGKIYTEVVPELKQQVAAQAVLGETYNNYEQVRKDSIAPYAQIGDVITKVAVAGAAVLTDGVSVGILGAAAVIQDKVTGLQIQAAEEDNRVAALHVFEKGLAKYTEKNGYEQLKNKDAKDIIAKLDSEGFLPLYATQGGLTEDQRAAQGIAHGFMIRELGIANLETLQKL
jgi:hypothetical protein